MVAGYHHGRYARLLADLDRLSRLWSRRVEHTDKPRKDKPILVKVVGGGSAAISHGDNPKRFGSHCVILRRDHSPPLLGH